MKGLNALLAVISTPLSAPLIAGPPSCASGRPTPPAALNPHAPEFYADWDGIADAAVGSLRAEAGRNPGDRALTDLVGQLALRSD